MKELVLPGRRALVSYAPHDAGPCGPGRGSPPQTRLLHRLLGAHQDLGWAGMQRCGEGPGDGREWHLGHLQGRQQTLRSRALHRPRPLHLIHRLGLPTVSALVQEPLQSQRKCQKQLQAQAQAQVRVRVLQQARAWVRRPES